MADALRHIGFDASSFPSEGQAGRGAFYKQLVDTAREESVRSTTIYPWPIHEWARERRAERAARLPADASADRPRRPLMMSFSNRRIGCRNSFGLPQRAFEGAVWKALRSLDEPPDALYDHFLHFAGQAAMRPGRSPGRPSFVGVGERTIWSVWPLGFDAAPRDLAGVTIAVAVSTPMCERLVEDLGFPPDRVRVLPNGVDCSVFFPRSRQAMRGKHAVASEALLGAFVGNVLEPKGVLRVASAIDELTGIAGGFVGPGPDFPVASNVVFRRLAARTEVPEMPSAADCFGPPNDGEESSNATLGALACGLPFVASEDRFNDDIVTPEDSIRVPRPASRRSCPRARAEAEKK